MAIVICFGCCSCSEFASNLVQRGNWAHASSKPQSTLRQMSARGALMAGSACIEKPSEPEVDNVGAMVHAPHATKSPAASGSLLQNAWW